MKRRALLAFDDPGGGLAVCSLIEELKKKDLSLEIYAGKLSERIVKPITSNYYNIESEILRKEADRILDNFMPHIIVTGTGGGNAEQQLRNSAREKKIRSVVILDFWKDYARRWKFADYPIGMMKDKVCIMDECTKQEMIAEGFPSENLFVTGHPYLDEIFSNANPSCQSEMPTGEEINILFLSQPLKVLGGTEQKPHPLIAFLNALKKHSANSNKKVNVTIKLHPSELQSEEIDKIAGQFKDRDVKVKYALPDSKMSELFEKNHWVVGYNTIAMFESRAAGKRTLSLSVGKINESLKEAMSLAGIEIVDCEQNDIEKAFSSKIKSEVRQNSFHGGISNCINLIMNQFNLF